MLAAPPAILDLLHLETDAPVGVTVDNGRLMVEPQRHRYTLDELLSQCDVSDEISAEDREWLDDKADGNELL